ncbi:hypothetical protein, partial [Enterobacter hormaechei]
MGAWVSWARRCVLERDLGQQGLFDITRTVLQQPDLGALRDALTRLVRQSALADSAAIVLWDCATHRASYFS